MDDLISRKAVLNKIRKVECEPGYQHQGEDWAVGLCIAESIVEEAESVESKWKKGRLKTTGFFTCQCSECGAQFHELEYTNFCPNCGADMRDK